MLNVIIEPDTGRFVGFCFDPYLENDALIMGYHIQSISYEEAEKFLKFFDKN